MLIHKLGHKLGHSFEKVYQFVVFKIVNFEDHFYSHEEYKNSLPFTITKNKIKYLEINLTKEVKKNCFESYKTLKKTEINGSLHCSHG